jgi:hypothetical protein
LSYKQQTTVVNKQQLIQQEGYTMKKTGWTILLATALSYIPVVGAQEQTSEEPFKTADWRKDFTISIGTKLWFNEWTTWNTPTNAAGETVITSSDSDDYEFIPIPAISVKYQELIVSASYFVDTNYNFPTRASADRKEWDVTVGYYIFPPYLALTVGFKDIEQRIPIVSDDFGFDIAGPIVGFAGAVPMKWGFSLYGSFAYGFLESESDFFEMNTPGDDDRDSAYWLVETGIAYTHKLQNLPVNLLLSSATVYAGYRHQQVETDDVGIFSAPGVSGGNTADDGLDITRGMVIGVNLSF